ncbi:ubiquinol--cytochrome-c reductase subunit 8 [Taxawa tesnikishii (nom. ined.)]|nr:ubiquinol--cytochrome-c reductase subunit 8 [Dothideales sp. JES 119]
MAGGGDKKPGQYVYSGRATPQACLCHASQQNRYTSYAKLDDLNGFADLFSTGTWDGGVTLGIVTYGLAQNRQRALAGTANAAVFNVYRRTKAQILFWAVPLLVGYELMNWATERNEFLNSKEGRALYADSE